MPLAMGAPILTEMPAQIRAGTTLEYTRSLPDFPADDGWGLAVRLAGPSVVSATVTPSGKVFGVVISTAALLAGTYQWNEIATKGGKSYEAAAGVVEVLLNLATANAGDAQSWEEKALAALEAALAGDMSSRIQQYSIYGRQIQYWTLEERMKLRAQLKAAVWRQRNPGKIGQDVAVQFTRPE